MKVKVIQTSINVYSLVMSISTPSQCVNVQTHANIIFLSFSHKVMYVGSSHLKINQTRSNEHESV